MLNGGATLICTKVLSDPGSGPLSDVAKGVELAFNYIIRGKKEKNIDVEYNSALRFDLAFQVPTISIVGLRLLRC